MATEAQRSRCRERIFGVCGSSAGALEWRLEAMQLLQRTIGFDRWCWSVGDPDSLLAGGDLAEADLWPVMPRLFALEQWDEVSAAHVLARGERPVGGLSVATGGDLARSRCWDECLRAHGVGDQATVVLRDAYGSWGYLKAWRNREDRPFEADDLRLLEEVSACLGSAMRRRAVAPAALQHAHATPEGSPTVRGDPDQLRRPERPAGVLILDAELRPQSATPSAEAWLAVLPGATMAQRRGYLPQTVYAVAARASALGNPSVGELPARLRTRTAEQRWAVVEAAPLEGAQSGAIAVTVRAASSAELLGLLARAHALTPRESQVLQLVVAGHSTAAIAGCLCISTNTLQDHLKAIFDKVGVRTRRELIRETA